MQDGAEKISLHFLELICYCANKCQSVTVILCDPFAQYLYRLAGIFHQVLVFSLKLGAYHQILTMLCII